MSYSVLTNCRFQWDGAIGAEVKFGGIDMGGRCTIVARDGDVVAVHVAGHSGWFRVGERKYYGADLHVFKIERDRGAQTDERDWRVAEHLIEMPLAAITKRKRSAA